MIARIPAQIFALAALTASAILAQDITGTWQGKEQAGAKELRIVLKITRTDQGELKGVLYSLDEGARPIGARTVVVEGSTVKISFPFIGGEYEGKLAGDGATLTGTWKSNGKSFPLTMTRATETTAWEIPSAPARRAMAPDASPGFEVATIKLSDPNGQNSGFKSDGRRIFAVRESVRALIMFGYNLNPRQIASTPPWADADFFDVDGLPDQPGVPSLQQMREMYRKLLLDRFHMVCHTEKRESSVYILTVAKSGPKITPSASAGNMPDQTMNGAGNLRETNATLGEFAGMLQGWILDRPVLDQTGLQGRFDFVIRFTPDARKTDDPNAPPDLFAAMQQQLGLKLEAAKAPADVLVVDKIERPSENWMAIGALV